jgi:hypothetical protein
MSGSKGWTKGTVALNCPPRTTEVPGWIKGGYGVSRGETGNECHRLTHLATGKSIYTGSSAACKRLADALHQALPKLGLLKEDGLDALPPEEVSTLKGLVRRARETER